MKAAGILLLLTLSLSGYSQKPYTVISLGLGNNIEKRFPYYEKKDNGRIVAAFAMYFPNLLPHDVGVQLLVSGRVGSLLGGSGSYKAFDDNTNTRILGYNNLNATSLLLKNRFFMKSIATPGDNSADFKFYFDMGLGVTRYAYSSVTASEGTTSRSRLAVSPEIGIQHSTWQVSALMIFGGKTPSFSGFDTFSNMNVSLNSISSQQVYLMVGFRLWGEKQSGDK